MNCQLLLSWSPWHFWDSSLLGWVREGSQLQAKLLLVYIPWKLSHPRATVFLKGDRDQDGFISDGNQLLDVLACYCPQMWMFSSAMWLPGSGGPARSALGSDTFRMLHGDIWVTDSIQELALCQAWLRTSPTSWMLSWSTTQGRAQYLLTPIPKDNIFVIQAGHKL